MKQQGTITQITPPETFGTYTKRLVVIGWKDRSYDRTMAVEFGGKKLDLADKLNIGDEIEVSFDVQSRESKGRWFTSAVGWQVETLAAGHAPEPQTTAKTKEPDDGQIPF